MAELVVVVVEVVDGVSSNSIPLLSFSVLYYYYYFPLFVVVVVARFR